MSEPLDEVGSLRGRAGVGTQFGPFVILACAYINSATDGFKIGGGACYLLAFVAATAYGLILETIQDFLPWRSTELEDALADLAGAATEAAACWLLYRRLARRLIPRAN